MPEAADTMAQEDAAEGRRPRLFSLTPSTPLPKQLVTVLAISRRLVQKQRPLRTKRTRYHEADCTNACIYLPKCNIRITEARYFVRMADYAQQKSTSCTMIKNMQSTCPHASFFDTMPLLLSISGGQLSQNKSRVC